MITTEAQKLLIPTARCLDIAYRDHGLRLHCANGYHDADSVSGRIVDLGKPALTTVELRAPAHCAAVGFDESERVVDALGRDPHNRSAGGGWRDVAGQLADHSGCLKAPAVMVDGPSEDVFVEGGGALDINCRKLEILNLAVRRRSGFHLCSIDYGYAPVN